MHRFAIVLLLALTACQSAPTPPRQQEVSFAASDGVTVYADTHVGNRRNPILILFHQGGGDARGEYGSLIPWLLEQGYNVMAVDARMGGDRFGGKNRTAAAVPAGKFTYCDAYRDVEAAVRYAREQFRAKPVIWGSSYSAALALKFAAEHADEISGVLAFSPAGGEPMKACDATPHIAQIKVPALVVRASRETEVPWIREQTAIFKSHGVEVFVPPNGEHGSSTLVAERVKAPVDAQRARVAKFLRELK